ncbi:MAG: hypothetical protein ACFFG0_20570 [Candidatus Thorarchaeota archaeon]
MVRNEYAISRSSRRNNLLECSISGNVGSLRCGHCIFETRRRSNWGSPGRSMHSNSRNPDFPSTAGIQSSGSDFIAFFHAFTFLNPN